MDDDIKLPVLPTTIIPGLAEWLDDIRRAAVLADRERRAKQEAKPVVRSVKIELCKDGTIYANNVNPTGGSLVVSGVTIRWADDGSSVWIESERNRELARRLRYYPTANFDEAAIRGSADALDGGEL